MRVHFGSSEAFERLIWYSASSIFRQMTIWSSLFQIYSYGGEYEPYARPDSHMGFVMNGGHPMDPYGHMVDEYGNPVDEYGRPLMMDEYEQYGQGYGGYGANGMADEEDYMYSSGMR